jgi:hypothetical protein
MLRVSMNPHEYRLVAGGGAILLIFLTIFWYVMLKRLSTLLGERLAGKGKKVGRKLDSVASVFLFLFRDEYKRSGDEVAISVCRRLRSLLYGYLGTIGAYVVFVIFFRPRF